MSAASEQRHRDFQKWKEDLVAREPTITSHVKDASPQGVNATSASVPRRSTSLAGALFERLPIERFLIDRRFTDEEYYEVVKERDKLRDGFLKIQEMIDRHKGENRGIV